MATQRRVVVSKFLAVGDPVATQMSNFVYLIGDPQAKKAVLVDVRTPAEFAAGHIAGATNIDVEAADFATKIGALDKGAAYALYCRSGNRSGVAMQAMLSSGFTHVFHLGGGIGAWQSAGQPVVQ